MKRFYDKKTGKVFTKNAFIYTFIRSLTYLDLDNRADEVAVKYCTTNSRKADYSMKDMLPLYPRGIMVFHAICRAMSRFWRSFK